MGSVAPVQRSSPMNHILMRRNQTSSFFRVRIDTDLRLPKPSSIGVAMVSGGRRKPLIRLLQDPGYCKGGRKKKGERDSFIASASQ